MKWQRTARMIAAVVGVGTAVTLYVSTRERPAPAQPTGSTVADPNASVQATGGSTTRYRGEERALTVEFASSKRLTDGRSVLEKAKLTLADGTTITADYLESKGAVTESAMPNEFYAKGNVAFVAPDGLSLKTGEASMSEVTNVASIPGAITFTRGRMTGTGTGGTYEGDTGVFKIHRDAHLVIAPGDGGGAIDARSSSLTFNRIGKAVLLEEQARIETATDLMTADRATLYLTDDNEQFRLIELRGQPGRSRVAPRSPDTASNTPEMQALNIDLAFHAGTEALQHAVLTGGASMVLGDAASRRSVAGGSIQADTALDGKTMTRLDARDRVEVRTPPKDGTPARVITSATLLATGDEKAGLTLATFAGGVVFTETAGTARGQGTPGRTATSQSLVTKLRGGQLDDIDEAQFQQNVTFKAADVTGLADLVTYRAAKAQLVLQPVRNTKRPPSVTSADVKVDATELVEIDLNTDDVHARGEVKTVSAGKGAAGQRSGALFNDRDPILGFATEFWYDGTPKRARYRGQPGAVATLRQGESVVSGQMVELVEDTQDLTAKGTVETVMLLVGGGRESGPPKRYRVVADALDYKDKTRAATYTSVPSAPVVMTGADGVTSSETMTLTMAQTGRTLERLDARGDVHLTLNEGREALASTLLYEAARDRYTIRGRPGEPVVLRAKGDTPNSCSGWRGLVGYFTLGTRAPEFPQADNPGGVKTWDDESCTGPLTR